MPMTINRRGEEQNQRMPTMRKIVIFNKGGTPDCGFAADLRIDGGGRYEVAITNPFQAKQEADLEQYFDEWQRFPFTNTTIAERASRSIKVYGMNLFNQIFASGGSRNDYKELQDQLSDVLIEIVSQSPDFHALHWEALWDPARPRPLVVDCALVRSSLENPPPAIPIKESPVVNLLVVVARPRMEWDVGYRSVSRPLVEAVQAGELRVNVELLRPGTFKALSKRLKARGPGYYHIVQFDCHGGLLNHAQAKETLQYRVDGRYGRKPLKMYKGLKAFLMLEGATAGTVDLVKALEIGKLLAGAKVPICVLNACESGKQVLPEPTTHSDLATNPRTAYETSLGSCLLREGVQVVVAMAFRVTVSAGQILMKELYGQICAQQPIFESLRLGRMRLYSNKKRRAYRNKMVDLEDWLLPVVYANQPIDLMLCECEDRQEQECSASLHSCYYIEPKHGFVGRDLDILKIEAALMRHNALLLQGMGGSGKTTLLKYLCEWWQVTHFALLVFYFGYDQHVWVLQQILMGIVRQICDEHEQRKFQALSDAALMNKVVERLKGNHCILILDNLESTSCKELPQMTTLPLDERAKICHFLNQLVEGHTKVVLGSRRREDWLAYVYCDNVHHLQGLDLESQYVFAQKILERCGGDESRFLEWSQDDDYHHLLRILGGYPLAMEVVLANLEHQTSKQILEGLENADVHLDAPSEEKDRSILSCVEYSFSALSQDAQQLLVCLAPFKSMLVLLNVDLYIKELQKFGAFEEFNFDRLERAIHGATKCGLLSPYPASASGEMSVLNVQPVLPFFLKTKLEEADEHQRVAVRTSFKAAYCTVANQYCDFLLSNNPQQRAAGLFVCEMEYENLLNALVMCLEDMDSTDIRSCLYKYFDTKGDYQNGLKLAKMVLKTLGDCPFTHRTGETEEAIADTQFWIGVMHYRLNDPKKAKEVFEQARAMVQSAQGDTANVWSRVKCGLIYYHLGLVSQAVRDFEGARHHYQKALGIWKQCNDRKSQANTYHQMGMVAQEIRDFVDAHENYKRAVDIYIELNDLHAQATTYHQMGVLSQTEKDLDRARENYWQALGRFQELGDRHIQATIYHQLGWLAQESMEFVAAREYYQAALDMQLEFNDRYSQASTYHQMGMLAQSLGDFVEARQNYLRALEIFGEYGDRHSQSKTYHQLGMAAQRLKNFAEADQSYRRALAMQIESNDRHSHVVSYLHMGGLAKELRNFAEAGRSYQQAPEICIETVDRRDQAQSHFSFGTLFFERDLLNLAEEHVRQGHELFVHVHDQRRAMLSSQYLEGIAACRRKSWTLRILIFFW